MVSVVYQAKDRSGGAAMAAEGVLIVREKAAVLQRASDSGGNDFFQEFRY
jgi:hypothetical protein